MKKSRNLWPAGVLGAFAAFFAGTITLVVMACSHRGDLVSADYYEQEMLFQRQLDRMDRTRHLSGEANVAYDAEARRIQIRLPVRQGGPPLTGQILLYRPSAAVLDRQCDVQPDASGVQSLDANGLRPGLWKVRVSWTAEEGEYFVDRSVVVLPQKGNVLAQGNTLVPSDPKPPGAEGTR